MKSINILLMTITLLLSFVACTAQNPTHKTEIVKIYGNCEMCKATIEKAGNQKNIAQITWDKDTKMATIQYDTTKTSVEKILKRIALAGYDSEKFTASEKAYEQLHKCCQYKRKQ